MLACSIAFLIAEDRLGWAELGRVGLGRVGWVMSDGLSLIAFVWLGFVEPAHARWPACSVGNPRWLTVMPFG